MNDMSRRVPGSPAPIGARAAEPTRRAPRGGRRPFGVLDIGTTKIVCLIGRTESDGALRVLGFGWQRAAACAAAASPTSRRRSARSAPPSARPRTWPTTGCARVIVNLSCGRRRAGCSTCNGRSAAAPSTEADIRRVVNEGRARAGSEGRETIHALPLGFTADESEGVTDPRGLHCEQLTARLHVVDAGDHRAAQPRRLPRRAATSKSRNWSRAPMAAGLATLVEDERRAGRDRDRHGRRHHGHGGVRRGAVAAHRAAAGGRRACDQRHRAAAVDDGRARRAAEDAVRQRASQRPTTSARC